MVLVTLLYCVVCMVLPFLRSSREFFPVVLQISTNLALFLVGINVLIKGLSLLRGLHFYAGIGIILLQVVCRYIDLIGNYVGGSIVFLVAGVMMICAARFWNRYEQNNKNIEVAV